MAVITISRQTGSGGEEIAERLCQVLGYQLFDKRLIVKAAAESGLTEHAAIDYPEESYQVRGFLDRLFNRGNIVQVTKVWRENPYGERSLEEVTLSEEAVVALVEHAIRSGCQHGNMIIIGRGGQVVLRDRPGVLHFRIEAPLEQRIQTVKDEFRHARQEFHADIELRREAQDWIERRDEISADYLRRFYEADINDALLYHLMINTGRISIEQAADLIARMALELRPPEKKTEQMSVAE